MWIWSVQDLLDLKRASQFKTDLRLSRIDWQYRCTVIHAKLVAEKNRAKPGGATRCEFIQAREHKQQSQATG